MTKLTTIELRHATKQVVRWLREREIRFNHSWPGKDLDSPVKTRVPNVAAEIAAHEYSLNTPADHAGVSKEVMAAVLEDGETLLSSEFFRLHSLFSDSDIDGIGQCSMEYLYAPVLPVVYPETHKGMYQQRLLRDALELASDIGSPIDSFYAYKVRQAQEALQMMQEGKLITYAEWRRAYMDARKAARSVLTRSKRTRRIAK